MKMKVALYLLFTTWGLLAITLALIDLFWTQRPPIPYK